MASDESKPAADNDKNRIVKPGQGFTHEHVEGFTSGQVTGKPQVKASESDPKKG